jgi:hypothetical protein
LTFLRVKPLDLDDIGCYQSQPTEYQVQLQSRLKHGLLLVIAIPILKTIRRVNSHMRTDPADARNLCDN